MYFSPSLSILRRTPAYSPICSLGSKNLKNFAAGSSLLALIRLLPYLILAITKLPSNTVLAQLYYLPTSHVVMHHHARTNPFALLLCHQD